MDDRERDRVGVGVGVRCLVGYNTFTGSYAILSYIDGLPVGHTELELYADAVAFADSQREQVHSSMVDGAPVGARVFEVNNTRLDADELVTAQAVQEVDEAFILDRYAYTPENRPHEMAFRFFASMSNPAAFAVVAKAPSYMQYGVMILSSIGEHDGKHVAKLQYRPKLAPSEEAAANEARIWLASELMSRDEAAAREAEA